MFVEEKSKGEVPDFKLGTLRLSTAIRIGAAMRPQCFGFMFDGEGTCAIGAAYEVAFQQPPPKYGGFTKWDELCTIFGVSDKVLNDAAHKNDCRLLSRESIADWLEGQGY